MDTKLHVQTQKKKGSQVYLDGYGPPFTCVRLTSPDSFQFFPGRLKSHAVEISSVTTDGGCNQCFFQVKFITELDSQV